MIERFTYIALLAVFMWLPALYFWWKNHRFFLKHKDIFFYISLFSLIMAYFWDLLAIKDNVWFFPNIVGVWILGLPLEEWLFFISVSITVASFTLAMIKGAIK